MAKPKDDVTRRDALKTIGAGLGVIASLPVLSTSAAGQHQHNHGSNPGAPQTGQAAADATPSLKFFTADEFKTVDEMSERIIPADDSSPGARAARVASYIDMVVSLSSDVTKQTWREGLAAVDKKSREMFENSFAAASVDQQVELLKEISKNERTPQTMEERFFRAIKYATVDGYYTSEIGIHKELRYKGNSYLKEFTGCTHPEHQQ
jgi:hypothetical protein